MGNPSLRRETGKTIDSSVFLDSRVQVEHEVGRLFNENAALRDQNVVLNWINGNLRMHLEVLHRDRSAARKEEAERQRLFNRLRDMRLSLLAAQEETKEALALGERMKTRDKKYIGQLQSKIESLKKEKESWQKEAAQLRGQHTDIQNLLRSWTELSDRSRAEFNELTVKMSHWQPRIDQIQTFERQVEALKKMKSIEESDTVRDLRKDSAALEVAEGTIVKLQISVQSLEHANEQLQNLVAVAQSEALETRQKLVAQSAQMIASRNRASQSPSRRYRRPSINLQNLPLSSPIISPRAGIGASSGDRRSFFVPGDDKEDEALTELQVQNEDLKEDVAALSLMLEKVRADLKHSEAMRERENALSLLRQRYENR